MKVKISADSTCDLPKALIEKYDIGIMPLYIIRAGESLKDGEEITTPEVFDYTARTGELCGTAAVTIMDYVNAWTALPRRKSGTSGGWIPEISAPAPAIWCWTPGRWRKKAWTPPISQRPLRAS